MDKNVYLYVFDTMADWEIGYLTAELNSGRYFRKGALSTKIITVGIGQNPVRTMGGLKITPDVSVDAFDIKSGDALILPGGDTWTDAMHEPILRIAGECIEAGALVGAICGATFGLAGTGALDSRRHTSNDLGYLKMVCPNYAGEHFYAMEPAVTDRNLITASGVAPLEFTVHVIKALGVFSERTLDAWYRLYKTQDPKSFFDLMGAVQEQRNS